MSKTYHKQAVYDGFDGFVTEGERFTRRHNTAQERRRGTNDYKRKAATATEVKILAWLKRTWAETAKGWLGGGGAIESNAVTIDQQRSVYHIIDKDRGCDV